MLTAEKNRVARAPGAIRADIQVDLTWLEQRLADLPELGPLSCQHRAALVGIAPLTRDRGPLRGKRTV
jgi:hypothetical protein